MQNSTLLTSNVIHIFAGYELLWAYLQGRYVHC